MDEFSENVLKKAGLAALLTAAFVLLPALANAGIVPVGSPTGTNDWNMEWVEQNSAMVITGFTFTMLTPGVTFTGQTTAYSDQGETSALAGWSGTYSGVTASVSTTGAGTLANFYWTTSYSPANQSTPFSYAMEAWSGATFDSADSIIAAWSNGSFTYQALNAPVPEASGVSLLGIVLVAGVGLAGIRVGRAG